MSADQDLRGLNFQEQDLRGTSFVGADLEGACFIGADLRGCDFTHANLAYANFALANVEGAIFHKASFNYATLFDPLPYVLEDRPITFEDNWGLNKLRSVVLEPNTLSEDVQELIEPLLAMLTTPDLIDQAAQLVAAFGNLEDVDIPEVGQHAKVHEYPHYMTIDTIGEFSDSRGFDRKFEASFVGKTILKPDELIEVTDMGACLIWKADVLSKPRSEYFYNVMSNCDFIDCNFFFKNLEDWQRQSIPSQYFCRFLDCTFRQDDARKPRNYLKKRRLPVTWRVTGGSLFDYCTFNGLKIAGMWRGHVADVTDDLIYTMPPNFEMWLPPLKEMERIQLIGCTFNSVTFNYLHFESVDFIGCTFTGGCRFTNCEIKDSTANECDFGDTEFMDVKGMFTVTS